MEHLTYSLWFTLVWWTALVALVLTIDWIAPNEAKRKQREHVVKHGTISDTYFFIYIPAIAILLEYLIMR